MAIVFRKRSFCTRSASSIAFNVSESSGNASLGMTKSDHIRPNFATIGEASDSLSRRINHQPGCIGVTVSRAS